MKVCVIGQGYIGLPTAALFAANNCKVLGIDINKDIVNSLNKGIIHIEEPGIEEILKSAISNEKYNASLTPKPADVFIITVPTPIIENNFSCDLSYVISACESILPYLKKNNCIIIESTIAPMSTDDYIKPIFEKEGWVIGKDIFLSHCPERVLPGKIMEELINNDRIVGGITPQCANKAADIYKKFVKGNIIKTEAKTAELSKCMENTFRDVNIALANELAKICSNIGVNTNDVIEMANKHPRVNIHSPGPGVGGHCLAIDPYFIYSKSPENAKLIKTARDINNSMPKFVVEKTKELIKNIDNPKIAILGVAYKGNTNDTRESPGIKIAKLLGDEGYNINIFDPYVENPDYVSFENSIEGADIALILSDHLEFKKLDFKVMISKMNNVMIFDTKNIIKTQDDEIIIINYNNIHQYIEN